MYWLKLVEWENGKTLAAVAVDICIRHRVPHLGLHGLFTGKVTSGGAAGNRLSLLRNEVNVYSALNVIFH